MKKILITSIGRTGTVSLAHFLNEIPGVICFHEKERQDVSFLFLSQLDQYSSLTKSYIKKRNKEINSLQCDFYIEVNPYLRYADNSLLSSLGWKKIFLVRNPKTYIESVFVRKLFTTEDTILNQYPDNDDSYSNIWHELSRFQKICWYYAKTHQYILSSNNDFYRFEDFINNPENLKFFVENLGIEISKVKSFNLPKLNTSLKHKLRRKLLAKAKGENYRITPIKWANLKINEKETYKTLCETLEKKLGYVL